MIRLISPLVVKVFLRRMGLLLIICITFSIASGVGFVDLLLPDFVLKLSISRNNFTTQLSVFRKFGSMIATAETFS
jgi:hypothetical protein